MRQGVKKQLWFALKCLVSAGIIYLIFQKIYQRQDADKLVVHLQELRWPWVAASALSLLTAIGCSLVRWQRLLVGQGIRAPWRHLFGTFMIGRFFGAVTPGGLGLGGYRIYDISKHTGKTARAVASIGIEMVLGNLAVGIVAFISCFFGMRYVGARGFALLAGVFGSLIAVTFTILWRPRVVRLVSERLPGAVRQRLQSMVDAVCAYEGKGWLLGQSELLAMGTHTFNGLIYVCAAKGLGIPLPWTELFFVSVLQNVAAHIPVTPNGVGLREGAAVGLYAMVGVPPEQAVLIPIVGFSVEMAISALGGLVLLSRRSDYVPIPAIVVEDEGREDVVRAQIERVPESAWPRVGRGFAVGLGAGLLAGLLVGLGEAWAIVVASHGKAESDVWFFGATTYAIICGALGAIGAALLAFSGRLMQRRALPEETAFAHLAALLAAVFGFVIGLFRVQRDVYQEELVFKSVEGALVLLGALASALALYAVLFFVLRALAARNPTRLLLRPVGSLGLAALAIGIALVAALLGGERAAAFRDSKGEPTPRAAAGSNVLYIVVDTLRADHLPSYGYSAGTTPHLDAFSKDAVRFENAYANASWTRPSFASLMTGRYASSHGVMSKSASLPDAVDTVAELYARGGYTTGGIVTNYNVAPFFNFQQGFDEYHYLAPDFLFGASDTAAKLSLLQVLRRVDERARAAVGSSRPGAAYQDAEVLNREIFGWLDARQKGEAWFLFAAFMDPHDPYYEHPYNGVGYSRAAHVKPDPSEADKLRKLYDGEITYWDEHFGKLVAELKQRGLYDALTIVVTADHGEEFMEHGGFWHGTSLYDEQLHVPLFVKLPRGDRAGTHIAHWVESVDVMPTLLSLSKLAIPEGVQGIDLFRGKQQTFAEESHEGNVLKSTRVSEAGQAWKVISANAGNPRGLKERELFRIDADPKEQVDLSEKERPTLARRESDLEAASKTARTGALKAREVDVSMDQAAQDRLKALGYANE